MENGLHTKAMLVNLSIGCWSARKLDKKESKRVTEHHNVTDKAARVTKSLLPEDFGSYKEIICAAVEARQEHYRLTLPWTDNGSRILLASNYQSYTEAIRLLRTRFDTAKGKFVPEYPALYENAKRDLKTLWKEDDYPSVTDIPNKFYFSIKVLPLPEANDFRVSLGSTDVEMIQDQIREDTKNSIAQAMKDPYRRLLKVVSDMAKKLNDKKGKFHDTLVTNIEDMVKLLPALNLMQDPELTKIGERILVSLANHEPDTLRKNTKVRKNVAQQADQICNDLAAFMVR